MAKKKIFISSVQAEFVKERKALYDYIHTDLLLGKFFEPFLFERLPAMDQKANKVYLHEVEQCDIYLGLLGKEYGFEDKSGVSPTEKEYNHATKHHKTRLLFLTNHPSAERNKKENLFIVKVQEVLLRKRFSTIDELKTALYASLIRYLEEKEIIRSGPFDASFNERAKLSDLDFGKVKDFVRLARLERGFPLTEKSSVTNVLTHLNLIHENRITNAAVLLFGKVPQRYFINSEVRCASFHGTIVSKPIPDYKVFRGSVFELVDQAVDFVLSKLSYSIGTRATQVQIPGGYEIPKDIVTEAIVNAVAHRDYTSNASVQVMLFTDRLEIWNPGSLPLGWTTEKLKHLHTSVPANPLLAHPMYLAGYIERLGTGTSDIIRIAKEAGLREPEYFQDYDFRAVLYRPTIEEVQNKYRTPHDTVVVPQEYRSTSVEVRNLILVLTGEMNRKEIQTTLELKHEGNFRDNYLLPALNMGFIEMTDKRTPNHPNQRYRLTESGNLLKQKITTTHDSTHDNTHDSTHDNTHDLYIQKLILAISKTLNRDELLEIMGLRSRKSFKQNYIDPAIREGYLEMTLPDTPKSKNQQYRLTAKGKELQKKLKK